MKKNSKGIVAISAFAFMVLMLIFTTFSQVVR